MIAAIASYENSCSKKKLTTQIITFQFRSHQIINEATNITENSTSFVDLMFT